jgi:hypothetical protein
MKHAPNLIFEIVASDDFQRKLIAPMINAFVSRLSRPGADGKTYRAFILDWLYLERPMLDRFIGERFNVQFEGPALRVDGNDYPLGGYIERQIEWVKIDPVEAFALRTRLRAAVDAAVTEWNGGKPMKFLPAVVVKTMFDRAEADAKAAQTIRDFLGSTAKPEGDR